jgi:nucleotide-binding universal stress UspA family protein
MHFKHILVTTDFSDVSKKAFQSAAYQAKVEGSAVTLLNVFEKFRLPPELNRVVWNPDRIEQMESDYVAEAKKQLQSLAKEYFDGLTVECLSIMSDESPAKVICSTATKKNCDLIVMSGSGRGGVGSFLLGSTVHKVLSNASCPVLVIPAK